MDFKKLSRMDAMRLRDDGFIFDDESKFMWHINYVKKDDPFGLNDEQMESKNKIIKWLKENHPELLL